MFDPGDPGPKCVTKRIRDDLTDRENRAERSHYNGRPNIWLRSNRELPITLEFRDGISNNRPNRHGSARRRGERENGPYLLHRLLWSGCCISWISTNLCTKWIELKIGRFNISRVSRKNIIQLERIKFVWRNFSFFLSPPPLFLSLSLVFFSAKLEIFSYYIFIYERRISLSFI